MMRKAWLSGVGKLSGLRLPQCSAHVTHVQGLCVSGSLSQLLVRQAGGRLASPWPGGRGSASNGFRQGPQRWRGAAGHSCVLHD